MKKYNLTVPVLLRRLIRGICLSALLIFSLHANATNYYLSNSGNDANNGTDSSSAWKTLTKLNSFKNLKPGDNVLFKRGDTFYGSIIVSNSGTAGNPITYGAYGTGEKPVITGFTNITDWKNLGGNIWESTDPVSTLSTCNMVVINGVNIEMGRWPNNGYLTYQSYNGKNSITSSSLTGTPDWTGAGIVVRKNHFIIDRSNITSQSGNTLNYSIGSNYSPTKGFGFFIQNDIKTLDTTDEWYYNKATNKISIYSTISPNNVRISTVDTLISISSKSNLSIDNINFTGSNTNSIIIDNSNNIAIQNCQFNFSGMDAVYAGKSSYLQISKSFFNHTNNNAISIGGVGAILKDSITNHISITQDTIKNTGTVAGMGKRKDEQTELTAIFLQGSNNIIENCVIDSTGYIPIWWRGNSSTIQNNFISTFSFIKDDGGGIYCWNYDDKPFSYSNQKILNNIILNGIGALGGSVPNPLAGASGLYFDGNAGGIKVEGNTISACTDDGILFHDAHDIVVKNNTLYNNGTQIAVYSDYTPMVNGDTSFIRNLYVTKNIFISKTPQEYNLASIISFGDISSFGIIDSNFYARPLDNNPVCRADASGGGRHFNNYTLSSWQEYSGFDIHSSNSTNKISDTSDLRFEYNATMVSKTIPLQFNYIDVRGLIYNGKIELPPYTSAILIKSGHIKNELPIAEAGTNKSITLPVDSTSFLGSATDDNGIITDYLWTKISGPSNYNITDTKSPITDVTGLTEGVYQFELKVTDNNGATVKDTIIITVNPSENIFQNANAGPDKTITLPVNTTILTGSHTDSDGYISNYLWEKISGPSDYNIENPNSAVTNVTGLTEGVYQFQLSVKDDKGAIGKDTVEITVNEAINIPPTANAGNDQNITLPTNSINLSGSRIDTDGSIASYEWTKISGPNSGTINNSNSASATATNLSEGVYQFELAVTDNKGAVARDTVNVTVNEAINIPPKADAGSDKNITLPTNNVTLSGTGEDTDGSISSYQWTKVSGPNSGTINNANSASVTATDLTEGTYQFELAVTDNKEAIAKDTVQVSVNEAINIPPTAVAGDEQTITLPVNTVNLNGRGADTDGSISSYQWIKISGPATGTINNANSASAQVNNLSEGVYRFELAVTDNKGAVAEDTIKVTVNEAIKINIPPTTNAGSEQTITLPVNTVNLNGTGADSDGSIASYQWAEISGPTSGTINNSSSASATATNLSEGVYQFELAVTDNKGAVARDTVSVTVNEAINIPPTASAGNEQTITLPVNTVNLNGTGTDSDGSIASYQWTKITGPNSGTINNADSASATVSNLSEGVYLFELAVTDNKGAIGKDTVKVTVNEAINIPPTPSAGSDKNITLPTNNVTLSGSGTDTDGTIVSYGWTKISGPSSGTINNADSVSATATNLSEGIYQFELVVTDNKGAAAKDTVQITVNEANIPPIADAGNDQTITLPVNTVNLNGSGTDTDGSIASYGWTKISGPNSGTINNASSASAQVNNLSEGVYQFELAVTDNKGAIGKDTVKVTVNEAINVPPTGKDTVKVTVNPAPNIPPTADAGNDQAITLPVNTVNLKGSGKDTDGAIASYEWTKISGPSSFIIATPSDTTTNIIRLLEGTYQFELTVTDNKGATAKDTVKVTVNEAINIPPTANAGNDLSNLASDTSFMLNGSGTDADGSIVSYSWAEISGPGTGKIISPDKPSTHVSNLVGGTYEFELTVTDNKGATGKDTVKVTVGLERLATDNQKADLKVYPNPVHDIATVEVNGMSDNRNVQIVISDITGKPVYKNSFVSLSGNVKQTIDISNLAKGSYVVIMFLDGIEKQSVKILKI